MASIEWLSRLFSRDEHVSDNCISQCEGGDCLRLLLGTHCSVSFDKTWYSVAHSQYAQTAFFKEGYSVQIKASDVCLNCAKLSWCLVSLRKAFRSFRFPIPENELLESHSVSA